MVAIYKLTPTLSLVWRAVACQFVLLDSDGTNAEVDAATAGDLLRVYGVIQ